MLTAYVRQPISTHRSTLIKFKNDYSDKLGICLPLSFPVDFPKKRKHIPQHHYRFRQNKLVSMKVKGILLVFAILLISFYFPYHFNDVEDENVGNDQHESEAQSQIRIILAWPRVLFHFTFTYPHLEPNAFKKLLEIYKGLLSLRSSVIS